MLIMTQKTQEWNGFSFLEKTVHGWCDLSETEALTESPPAHREAVLFQFYIERYALHHILNKRMFFC